MQKMRYYAFYNIGCNSLPPIFRRYALIQVSWYRMGIIGTDYKERKPAYGTLIGGLARAQWRLWYL